MDLQEITFPWQLAATKHISHSFFFFFLWQRVSYDALLNWWNSGGIGKQLNSIVAYVFKHSLIPSQYIYLYAILTVWAVYSVLRFSKVWHIALLKKLSICIKMIQHVLIRFVERATP